MPVFTLQEIKSKVYESQDYDFLKTNPHLKSNTILIGLGGSYAYGTNIETSDIDIRGIATRTKYDILTGQDFEQVIDKATDTTIYSLNKMIPLLTNCNPNIIEILGLNPEQYLYLSNEGKLLLENRKIFLSRKAVYSFGGYANQQLRRLDNKSQRELTLSEQNTHILNSLNEVKLDICDKYNISPDKLNLILNTNNPDAPINISINLKDFELNKLISIQSTFNNVIAGYKKLGKRNTNAIIHDKLGKHMMHLIRLYHMCFDILEKGEINTYRPEEHDFLMQVRNGSLLKDNQPTEEFFSIHNDLEKRLQYDSKNTSLPDKPNLKSIKDLHYTINNSIINKGGNKQ